MLSRLVLGLAIASCSESAAPNPLEAIAHLTEQKDKMCACQQPACVHAADEAAQQWHSQVRDVRLSTEDRAKVDQLVAALELCKQLALDRPR